MITLLLAAAFLACAPATIDAEAPTLPEPAATEAEPAALEVALDGELSGYFQPDGTTQPETWLPTLWRFGNGWETGHGACTGYIWDADPREAGALVVDAYTCTFLVEGNVLRLTIGETEAVLIPTISEYGEITFPWTIDEGLPGRIYLNPGWAGWDAAE